MSARRVVVTGGAGFIGSHLVDALRARGVDVTVYDNLSTGRRENVPADVRLITADVRDGAALRSALAGADAVYHLAARVSVRDSLTNFADDAEINLLGSLRVLHACAAAGVRRMILASSMAVYADSPTPAPVPETHPVDPLSPYGLAKLTAERYLLQLAPHLRVEPVVLRFFNTFGTRQTDTPYVGVISIFIRKLLRGEAPTIFGGGGQCRDFVHVSDIVAANVLALDAPAPVVCNVGTGRATSVNDIARLVGARLAPQIQPTQAPAQAGELRNCVADISRARAALGYAPRATLESHIDEVIAHLKRSAV